MRIRDRSRRQQKRLVQLLRPIPVKPGAGNLPRVVDRVRIGQTHEPGARILSTHQLALVERIQALHAAGAGIDERHALGAVGVRPPPFRRC